MPWAIATYHKLEKINERWEHEKRLDHVGSNITCGWVEQKSWERQYMCEIRKARENIVMHTWTIFKETLNIIAPNSNSKNNTSNKHMPCAISTYHKLELINETWQY